MPYLVSDTSVLIDLERGGLLEAVFSCAKTFVVPDLLYERELASDIGPRLLTLGLDVVDLKPQELEQAQQVSETHRGLSMADCFALILATRPDHWLITGDSLLRKVALARSMQAYGLLWLLDQMHDSGLVAPNQLAAGLKVISEHPRARLPANEVQSRMAAWTVKDAAQAPEF